MTKARLQAEAAESVPEAQPSNLSFPVQPYGRDSRESSPVVLGHDIPAYPHTNTLSNTPGMPSGFQGRISPHHSSWQQPMGVEGFETTSVASINSAVGSDYHGSDSAFSSGVAGLQQQDDGFAFSRSRSYGGGYEHHSIEKVTRPYASVNPFSDFPAGQNRRRASTLSPRPGLLYLHEDRPLGNAATEAGLASFEPSGRVYPRVGTIGSDTLYSEPTSYSQGSSPARFWTVQSGGVIGQEGLSNRPRTASAPSIRTVSQPSDGLFGYGSKPVARLPSTESLGAGGASGVMPNTAFEGVFDVSSGAGTNRGSDDFASVFRNPCVVGSHRPPPGFIPNVESSGSGFLSVSASRSHEFGLDVGWGSSSLTSESHQHPTRMRAHTDGEALFADSLRSILNFSGARGESDSSLRQNGFLGRVDPELDFNHNTAVSPTARFSTISPSQGSLETFPSTDNSPLEPDNYQDEKQRYF